MYHDQAVFFIKINQARFSEFEQIIWEGGCKVSTQVFMLDGKEKQFVPYSSS